MVKEDSNLTTADTILASGKIIKCMDMVNCIIKMVKLHTKGIGRTTNFVVLEEYLTINQKN